MNDAYADLYRRYWPTALAYARYFTRCPADQEDLAAEAFARIFALGQRGRWPSDKGFLGYLTTTIRHTAYDWHRQRRREQLADQLEVAAIDADPLMLLIDQGTATQEVRDLAQAMRTLEIRWQVVLFLRDIKQLPMTTVAEVLGLTPNSVSALAYRARAGLRKAAGAA